MDGWLAPAENQAQKHCGNSELTQLRTKTDINAPDRVRLARAGDLSSARGGDGSQIRAGGSRSALSLSLRRGPKRKSAQLRRGDFGLCCRHGLAAVGVVGNRCIRSRAAARKPISPPEVLFRARLALRLPGASELRAVGRDRVSRAQGGAPGSAVEAAVKNDLVKPPGSGYNFAR